MKHLKAFENYSVDITEDIALDLLPKLQQLRDKMGTFTASDFHKYMKERGADFHTADLTMSNLVRMGFDFDGDDELSYRPGDDDDPDGLIFNIC